MKKILSLLLLLLVGCAKDVPVIKEEEEKNQVSMVAVGDNLIHSSVYEAAAINDSYDFKPMLLEIKPYIKTFDLAFINQETILGGKEIGLSSYPNFNSPQELADSLVDAGFNIVSLANNHTLDRGEDAIKRSLDYWDQFQVVHSGALREEGSQVKIFTKNGIKFAYVAYTYGTNGIPHPKGKDYLANLYSNEKVKKDIETIRDKVDFVMVSMHWGDEYQLYPNKIQKERANYLASLGVDLIIGHHPHVIQPVDMIEVDGHKTFVIYSLGNFLSDQKGIDRLIGMGVSFEITKTITNEKSITQLHNIKARLLYRHKDISNNFNIKMFINLDDNVLDNYQTYFEEKKGIIKTYYQDIEVN